MFITIDVQRAATPRANAQWYIVKSNMLFRYRMFVMLGLRAFSLLNVAYMAFSTSHRGPS